MRKITLFLFSLVLMIGSVFAKHVDEATALQAGLNFLNLKAALPAQVDISDLRIVFKSGPAVANPLASTTPVTYYYVINAGTKGFVIISGDDAVVPVFGYSNQSLFNPNNIPQNTSKWLEAYKLQVRDAIAQGMEATDEINSAWQGLTNGASSQSNKRSSVSPLMATTWNQLPYYNAMCPGGSVTGCVATAMAQIMKYHAYPTTGTGFHSYNHSQYGTLSANFGSTTYQWSSMSNNVTSTNNAVATLMYQLGVSVDMDYSPQSSGAYVISSKSPVTNCSEYALKTYFGYTSVSGVERVNYSDAQWLAMLKTELDASRPVLYAGFGSGGGHCFVADGYDNNDFVHFNWGWGGAYDGYFSINSLNPSGTGTGGGSGGYNSGHQAVINIAPPSGGGTTEYKMALYNYVTPSANTISFTQAFSVETNFINKGTTTFDGDYAAAVFDNNYAFVDFIETKTGFSLPSNYVFNNNITFSTTGLVSMVPGTYYIGVFFRPNGGNWKQVENNGSYTNLVQIDVVNDNASMELYKDIEPSPSIFTQGKTASVNINVVNRKSSTFYGQYQLAMYDLKGNFIETIGTVDENSGLPPNYTYNSPYLTFTSSSITAEPGTYLLALWHKENGGNWELTGSGNFQNPVKVDVQVPSILPDQYEANNSANAAYNFTASFTNNNSTISTSGANCHMTNDLDYYKVVLPTGFDYTITPRLHDSYNSGNGNTYTIDALFSFSTDGALWSEAYDNYTPVPISMQNGGTIYFKIAPYFAGETGTYQFDIKTTRIARTGLETVYTDLIKVYPNPAKDLVHVDLSQLVADRLSVVNIQGQELMSMPVETGKNHLSIPLDGLPAGIYFIQCETANGMVAKKITVVK